MFMREIRTATNEGELETKIIITNLRYISCSRKRKKHFILNQRQAMTTRGRDG